MVWKQLDMQNFYDPYVLYLDIIGMDLGRQRVTILGATQIWWILEKPGLEHGMVPLYSYHDISRIILAFIIQ